MRIAIRRLRAALMLFRPQIEPHAEARFTEALRELGRIFGEARDWDVFCLEMLASAEEHGVATSWLDLLVRRLRLSGERRMRASRADQRPALTATVLGLAEWRVRRRASRARIARRSRAELGGVGWSTRCCAAATTSRTARMTELHALRKAMKKLRYSVEFLAPLYRHKQVKGYLHRCKRLLKQLGTLNDAVVAVVLAEQLGGERQRSLLQQWQRSPPGRRTVRTRRGATFGKAGTPSVRATPQIA